MLRFLRQIRQRLLTENRASKYLLYAVGEIMLVVIGILIALQIDNWNEKRIKQRYFEFELWQHFRNLQAEYYGISGMEDKIRYQLTLTDSLLNYPEAISDARLPGILQVLDDRGIRDIYTVNFVDSFLESNADDPAKHELGQTLNIWFLTQNRRISEWDSNNLGFLMKKHLQRIGVPLRFKNTGTPYERYISDAEEGFYSEQNLEDVRMLLKDGHFIGDLKTQQKWRKDILSQIPELKSTRAAFFQSMVTKYPFLTFSLNKMEIVGDATENGGWSVGYQMSGNVKKANAWELEITLTDGFVKFRTDSDWTFDWGRGEQNPDKLVFKGGDIPVKAGRYLVSMDLDELSYEFKLIR